ncbi:YadA-like family protein [Imbroritus primus]|uniref:YadA-like family protein n=1 Tax=Imbroritus primus TaxID=3058603 RepID=UPI003D160BB2
MSKKHSHRILKLTILSGSVLFSSLAMAQFTTTIGGAFAGGTVNPVAGPGSIVIGNRGSTNSPNLPAANASDAIVIGQSATQANTQYSIAIGRDAAAGGGQAAVALGWNALASGTKAVAVGSNAVVTGESGVAMGRRALALANDTTAVGGFATASQVGATAVGNLSVASGVRSTALGIQSQATADSSLALGDTAIVANGATSGIALGTNARANHANSLALGANSATSVGAQANYTAYGLAAPQSSAGEVSFGSAGAARTLTNVAAGQAATDAVNVSQLNQVAQNTATSLGGGASYDPTTGAYTAPTYNVANATYRDVGSALNALNNSVVSQGRAYTDEQIANVRSEAARDRREARAGSAAAMAVAGLPQPTQPDKNMVSMGASVFQGQSAVALGLSRVTADNRWVMKGAVTSTSRGQFGAAVGGGYQW